MDAHELRETWTTRELPILRHVTARLDSGAQEIGFGEIREALGLEVQEIQLGVHALEDAEPPYLRARWQPVGMGRSTSGMVMFVTERARRELGTWPTAEGLVSELAEALRQAADRAPESEEKSKMRSAAEALSGFARDVAVAVV